MQISEFIFVPTNYKQKELKLLFDRDCALTPFMFKVALNIN